MAEILRQALRQSIDEVLETMFFTGIMGEAPGDDPETDAPAAEIAAAMTFEGDPPGAMYLSLTARAAREIAADFLGVDVPDISDEQVFAVVRELANMICGSVLSRVESAATFRLATPRILTPGDEIPAGASNTRYSALLTNGCLTVQIYTGTAICPRPVPSAC